jgi:hypothetical protein
LGTGQDIETIDLKGKKMKQLPNSMHVRVVHGILEQEFKPGTVLDLNQIYTTILGNSNSSSKLRRMYPNNHNLKAKVRQSLQIIRNCGYLKFLDYSGHYEMR